MTHSKNNAPSVEPELTYYGVRVSMETISKSYAVWCYGISEAEVCAIRYFKEDLHVCGFLVINDANIQITPITVNWNIPHVIPSSESDVFSFLTRLGWLDGSGEYRIQRWLPLPNGNVLRICSGEESDEPDLLVDIYDCKFP